MFKVRLVFEKTGPAAYISHLDLMKCFQRAFRRAHLPICYSQGFNPHINLSIVAPLSTGFLCLQDVCDFDLQQEWDYAQLVAALNATFPPGLRALEAAAPQKKPGAIAWSRFFITFPGGEAQAMAGLLSGPVQVVKRSKRGSREITLGDYIHSITFQSAEEHTVCRAVLKAGDDPLNPRYITRALQDAGLLEAHCTPLYVREAILDDSHQTFR